MSELTFSQSERRNNFLVPLLIAFVVIGGIFAYVYIRPHRIADITITHTAILPEHTVFKTSPKSSATRTRPRTTSTSSPPSASTTASRFRSPSTTSPAPSPRPTTPPSQPPPAPFQKSRPRRHVHHLPRTQAPRQRPRFPAKPPSSPATTPRAWSCSTSPSPKPTGTTANPPRVTISFYHQDPFTVTIPKTLTRARASFALVALLPLTTDY